MVIHLADQGDRFPDDEAYAQFCAVLLGQLSRASVEQLSLPLTMHPKLRPVCNALIDQPGDRRSRADWAREVAMSERTFDRLVMKETGLSFGRWRQQLQLIVALRDLSAGISVQRVALTLGYESTTAFIIMFKKAFGVPPGRYIVDHRPQFKPTQDAAGRGLITPCEPPRRRRAPEPEPCRASPARPDRRSRSRSRPPACAAARR